MSESELKPDAFRGIVSHPQDLTVICGQAVNLWAYFFLPSYFDRLERLAPFVSKDIDVLGDADTFKQLKALGGWTAACLFTPKPGKDVTVVGFLKATRSDGVDLLVEVRRSVRGLDAADLDRVTDIEYDGAVYTILEPHALLKSKLANLAEISQTGRQDGRHVRILVTCVNGYLNAAHDAVLSGSLSANVLNVLLKETAEVIHSPIARRAEKLLSIDLREVIGDKLKESPHTGIRADALIAFSGHRTEDQVQADLPLPISGTQPASVRRRRR